MLGARRRQLTITAAAAVSAFYIRLTWLPGGSPYELFLLLNILVAILFKPPAVLTSVCAGLVAAHLLIWLEAGTFFTRRYWTLTIAYLVFSGLLLVFNRLGYRLSARVFREQRLKDAIFASSLHAIVTLDAGGRVVAVNAAAEKMFGYSRQQMTGQRLVDLIVPPELRQTFGQLFADARSSDPVNDGHRQLELQAVRKDRTPLSIELATITVELADGIFFITHIRDITERKTHELERERLLTEAQKANQVKDDLLANLSHEFRTPLNAILGWSKMLRRGQVPAERLGHVAEVIERNAQAQSKLVDDLLDSSLAVAGLIRLQPRVIDVESALRAAVDSIRPAASLGTLAVDCHVPANLGSVQVDPARLHQVLLNLLSNAVKFSSPGGTITLDGFRAGDLVTVRVTDTGLGIEPDFLPFVFERFRQADTSTTRNRGGVGLGLAFVKHLVDVMGGEITAESPGRGKGASFSVRFPVAEEGGQIQRPQPTA